MKQVILILGVVFFSNISLFAQKENKQISVGNKAYQSGDYKSAAQNYRQALKINPKNQTAKYNLANSLEKQKDAEGAEKLYQQLAKNGRKTIQSDAYYNNGVTQVHNKDLKNAVGSFKNALRKNPQDEQARENLQKALNEMKQQQQKQNQQNKQNNKQNKNDQQQQPKESPKDKQNKQNMDNLLKQLNEQEKDLQKKLQQQQQNQPRKQPTKDW